MTWLCRANKQWHKRSAMTDNGGNDIFFGGLGNDSLFGNSGNDELDGNEGNDRLFGNGGKNMSGEIVRSIREIPG
jgi:Ca2+-binding RTX toxin-like protein